MKSAKDWVSSFVNGQADYQGQESTEHLISIIRQAQAEAREQALNEALKACNKAAKAQLDDFEHRGALAAVAAIRALKTQQKA